MMQRVGYVFYHYKELLHSLHKCINSKQFKLYGGVFSVFLLILYIFLVITTPSEIAPINSDYSTLQGKPKVLERELTLADINNESLVGLWNTHDINELFMKKNEFMKRIKPMKNNYYTNDTKHEMLQSK